MPNFFILTPMKKQYINPYKQFTGVFIPDWLLESDVCSIHAKVTYALLCRYAGEDGSCYPKQTTLAKRLGVSRRTVINYLKELKDKGLIDVVHTQGVNRYYFMFHSAISFTSNVQDVALSNVQDVAHSYKESQSKESHINYVGFVNLWNECNGTNLRVTESKRKQIRSRLKGYTQDELEKAIRNRASDEWIKENDQGGNWNALFRNDEQVEVWLLRSKKDEPNKINLGGVI